MLFSKNGSIPKPETDGTEGWIEVPDAPEVSEGKELRWLNNEWVIRDPKPQDRDGYQWNWNHGEMAWVECEYSVTLPEGEAPPVIISMDSLTISNSLTLSDSLTI
ncbi:hypothetical protein EBZ39_08995 [bacterium]|nr:hypothetical protein [bacterium]